MQPRLDLDSSALAVNTFHRFAVLLAAAVQAMLNKLFLPKLPFKGIVDQCMVMAAIAHVENRMVMAALAR